MINYTPLHCHSTYSVLDGLSKPQAMAERCQEINASACALTDHGNIAGAIKFYTEMKKAGIKPILGCERYICEQSPLIKEIENKSLSHFIVLAKNYNGWKNLIRLVSESNRPDFYYHKPRLDLNILATFCDGDIIGICGHAGSLIADAIVVNNELHENWNKIGTDIILRLKQIFGKDNFFLEAQLMDQENSPIQVLLTK